MVTTEERPKSLLQALSMLSTEQQLEILRIRKAKKDPSYFNSYCFVSPNGTPWAQKDFHKVWLEALQEHKKVQIEAFRESAKTEQVSIGYVLWRLGHNPNLRVKIVSAD